jgi:uncharacterized membrane protein
MQNERLTAFSDGVIAIIITIMALELKVPHGAALSDLAGVAPTFLSYVLSFVYIAIYWNNHHHMFKASARVDGRVLWANMNLLFWLSLAPFTTAWMGENHFAPLPTAVYGASLLAPALAWWILEREVVRLEGADGVLARAIGGKLKGNLSLLIYAAAIAVAFFAPLLACALYVAVALMWAIPERQIEALLSQSDG